MLESGAPHFDNAGRFQVVSQNKASCSEPPSNPCRGHLSHLNGRKKAIFPGRLLRPGRGGARACLGPAARKRSSWRSGQRIRRLGAEKDRQKKPKESGGARSAEVAEAAQGGDASCGSSEAGTFAALRRGAQKLRTAAAPGRWGRSGSLRRVALAGNCVSLRHEVSRSVHAGRAEDILEELDELHRRHRSLPGIGPALQKAYGCEISRKKVHGVQLTARMVTRAPR